MQRRNQKPNIIDLLTPEKKGSELPIAPHIQGMMGERISGKKSEVKNSKRAGDEWVYTIPVGRIKENNETSCGSVTKRMKL